MSGIQFLKDKREEMQLELVQMQNELTKLKLRFDSVKAMYLELDKMIFMSEKGIKVYK